MTVHPARQPRPENQNRRIAKYAAILIIGAAILVSRLFFIQVIKRGAYVAQATSRQVVAKELEAQRGSMFVHEGRELFPVVTNKDYFLVYVEPPHVVAPDAVTKALTDALGLSAQESSTLLEHLKSKTDPYEPVKRKVTQQVVDGLKAQHLVGVGFVAETYRYYPEKNVGGHVFGFVGFINNNRHGQYGLEGYFDDLLAGKVGMIKSFRDALGNLITIGPRTIQPAQNGADLVLTLDRRIQFVACQKLKEYYDRLTAERGSVIVLEPKTGAVLAMCSLPDFNPDDYGHVASIEQLNNPAVFYDYEPGSVFKAITFAAGLDTGKIEPTTTYVDTGEMKIGGFTIKNFDGKARGTQTMVQALDESLNTGAIFVAQQVGNDAFKQYVKSFGFGQATGITLAGEVPGNISPLEKPGDIFTYTASYGQGVTATPIQLAAAFGAIANNGVLMKPYIVSEIRKSNGEVTTTQPQKVRQAITPKTASTLTGMLTSVVETSYDKKGRVDGYYFAGKTGTAQVAGSIGKYEGNKTIHTFIGFGPTSNPRFVILIRLDNPHGPRFASDSIAPMFRDLAKYLVGYYQIPPDY